MAPNSFHYHMERNSTWKQSEQEMYSTKFQMMQDVYKTLQFLVGLQIQQEISQKADDHHINIYCQSNSTMLHISFTILEIPIPITRVYNFPKI